MNLVRRAEWGARAGVGPPMKLPATGVYVHHSVTQVTKVPESDMRIIERVGVQRFGKFSYSYAIHPLGVVLEGAGLTVGAHTANRNSTTFGIVLIGNYDELVPTDPQVALIGELCRHLVVRGHLRRDFSLGYHQQVKQTACPGKHTIAAWPRIKAAVARPVEEDDVPQPTDKVDALPTPTGDGVWVLQRDGGIITHGNAPFYGAYPGLPESDRQGDRYFVAIHPHKGGYVCLSDKGEPYHFPAK